LPNRCKLSTRGTTFCDISGGMRLCKTTVDDRVMPFTAAAKDWPHEQTNLPANRGRVTVWLWQDLMVPISISNGASNIFRW